MADTYDGLSRPYDKVMNRTPGGTSPVITDPNDIFNQSAGTTASDASTSSTPSFAPLQDPTMATSYTGTATPAGISQTQVANNEGNFNDVWINTFIRSKNYKPGARGFNIDGSTGNASFADLQAKGFYILDPSSVSYIGMDSETIALYPTQTVGVYPKQSNNVTPNVYLYVGDETTPPGLYLTNPLTGDSAYFTSEGYSAGSANYTTLYAASLSVGVITGSLLPESKWSGNLGSSDLQWASVYCNTLYQSSDMRIKSDVEELPYGLETLRGLTPIQYTINNTRQIGLSAQEVGLAIPEAAINHEETSVPGTAAINYSALVPVLIKAVQDLSAKVEELEKRVP